MDVGNFLYFLSEPPLKEVVEFLPHQNPGLLSSFRLWPRVPCQLRSPTAAGPINTAFESRRETQGCTVGRDARMRWEKSIALSAACAASLMRERRRSSSKGNVVSTLPVL